MDDLIITIKPIEIWVTTIVVPPWLLIVHSTVEATVLVIVSVMSGELHAIQVVMSSHAVACCPYPPVLVPSNSESVVGAWSAHMKIVITGILGMAYKVIQIA